MRGCHETEISCGELYFVTAILINADDLVKLLAASGDIQFSDQRPNRASEEK